MRTLLITVCLFAFSPLLVAAPPIAPASPPPPRCAADDAPKPDGKCAVSLEEASRVAGQRLSLMRDAFTYFANDVPPRPGWFAMDNKGRSRQWCEAVINDVIDNKNITPLTSYGAGTRGSRPLFDPGFDAHRLEGEMLVNGYVTVRWKTDTLSLSTGALCGVVPGMRLNCTEIRYNGVSVVDTTGQSACSVQFYEAAYWYNWSKTSTRVELTKGTPVEKP